jgi:PKD repeat protein
VSQQGDPNIPGGQTQGQIQAQQQTLATGTFNANKTSGGAPLAVTFSGGVPGRNTTGGSIDILTFGDGASMSIATPASNTQTQGYSADHTYNTPGTYTAVLYNSNSGAQGQPAIGVITINVSGYTSGSGAYGIVSVTPTNPATVVFNVPNCGAYQVDWGDNTPISTETTSCPSNPTGPQQITLTHPYATAFAYTIQLKDGNGKKMTSAAISIQ